MHVDQLVTRIQDGTIDTVQVATVDMFGRLIGKRFTGEAFRRDVLGGCTHGCNYLLVVDFEMDPQPGYQLANWASGYGDFEMRPDPAACYLLPWEPGAALVLTDFHHHEGGPVEEAPRQVLRRQLQRLAERGLSARMASELEFFLFDQDYPAAAARNYTGLTPSSPYRIDYQLLQPGRDETLMRAIRQGMLGAEIPVENSKGEWGRGQHEINIRYGKPLVSADRHIVFKQGAKHLAQDHGKSITFMAKPFQGEAGSSCHIHLSLAAGKEPAFWDSTSHGGSLVFRQFLGGLMKYSRELCLFFAPTVNSYKRYESLSWAPTRLAWSTDNRTTGFRVVGHNASFRIENRMPGADANPYLAFAAMIAAGLAGMEEGLDCGPEYKGNAYVDETLPSLPVTLHEALDLWEISTLAPRAFTPEVTAHYLHAGRLEVKEFNAAVTDWERQRYFERI
jgi:glutamine synthetase